MTRPQHHIIEEDLEEGRPEEPQTITTEVSSAVRIVLVDRSSESSSSSNRTARPVSPLSMSSPLEGTSPSEGTIHLTQQPTHRHRLKLNEQQSFLLFVKVFSFYVDRLSGSSDTTTSDRRREIQYHKASLKQRFKALITKCTAENRRQNPDFMPLQPVVEHRLRHEMGEVLWGNAVRILQVYCQRQRIQLYDCAN